MKQIVIKISDKLYSDIEKMDWKNPIWASELYTAIHEGTVLPEHHGRLVDYDEMKKIANCYGEYAATILSHIKPQVIIKAEKEQAYDEIGRSNN